MKIIALNDWGQFIQICLKINLLCNQEIITTKLLIMSLIVRRNPTLLPSYFNSFFENFFSNKNDFLNSFSEELTLPAVNVSEKENQFILELAAPGINKDEIEISVANGMLTISAEGKEESTTEEKNYTRKEYNYRSFNRSFALPEDADSSSIEANYQDGIITLSIPRIQSKKMDPVKVEVK